MYLTNLYNEAIDMWSLGIITYALLTHKLPYDGFNQEEIIAKTIEVEPDFSEFKKISEDSEEFVKKLLQKSPLSRLTASEALKHSWLNS